MNITVQVDEVSLSTAIADVVALDEDGDPITQGERTIADMVAAQITDRLVKSSYYPTMQEQFRTIREDEIRKAVRPQVEAALAGPLRKTNTYGEPTGQETTLRELIVEEARNAVTRPAGNSYDRDKGTFLTQAVAAEVKKALSAEIASAVKAAREQVSAEIGQHVAAAVQAGLQAKR